MARLLCGSPGQLLPGGTGQGEGGSDISPSALISSPSACANEPEL